MNPDRRAAGWLLGAALACVLLGAGRGTARGEVACQRVGEAEVQLAAPATGDTLVLPHILVDPEQFEVAQDSLRFQAGRDYLLEGRTGRIVWVGEPPPRATAVRVRYRYLPLPLAGEWRGPAREAAASDAAPAGGEGPAPGDGHAREALPAGARLEVGGSKTFSLEFGNRQDVSLNQSLDLTLRGQLADRVEVSAVLTDRNLPLQPEGTTAELSDLDKVLISVTSPWGALHLGDLTVRQGSFQFLAHRRELEGVQALAGRSDGRRAEGALGRGAGNHLTIEFYGQDGKQGPYRLVTNRPEEETLVIAGSERVWLDARRLTRGEEADYTIDYSEGEVLFTTRNPITAASEIRVEVQVRRGVFDRGYASLSAASGDSAGGIAVAWMRENDDPGSSPTFDLTPEEREILQAAGDSVTTAMEGGVRYVGPGLGPYERVEADTLEAPIYVHLGRDELGAYRGSYEVSFTHVGEREGDYADSVLTVGETIYVYAGRGQGDHMPGRRLYLPESRDLLAVRGASRAGGLLAVSAEGAFSQHDRNVLSGREDGDNAGAAVSGQASLDLARALGAGAGRLALHGRYRGVDDRFSASEAIDPAFYAQRWNAPAGLLDGRDRRGAVGLTARTGGGLGLLTEWERLDAGPTFDGRRWRLRAERTGRLRALADLTLGSSSLRGEAGRERRGEALLGWSGGVDAEASFTAEDLRRGDGDRRQGRANEILALRLGSARLLDWARATLLVRERWDFTHRPAGRATLGSSRLLQAEIEAESEPSQAQVRYALTTTRDAEGRLTGRSNLADWLLAHRVGRRFNGDWRGKLTVAEAPLLIEKLVYAGLGGGHYDSLGQYVGVGDYELYYAEGDTSRLETRLDTALRLSGRPVTSGPLAPLEGSLYGRVQLSTPQSLRELLEQPALIVSGAAPLREHQGVARGELAWLGAGRAPVPRLRVEHDRSAQRSSTGFTRLRQALRQALETRWTARAGLQLRLDLGHDREHQAVESGAAGLDQSREERRRSRAGLETTWRFLEPLSGRLGGEVARDRFLPSGGTRAESRSWVGLVADVHRRGRLEAQVERRWAGEGAIVERAFLIERPGWRVTLNGSLRPWEGVTTTLSLRIDAREDRPTLVTGRMEARAYF